MAGSYQVPQFLDSGDKIIGPLNLRQFSYAFVGSFIAFAIFNIFASKSVILGIVAAAPFTAFIVFLAFGRFNGRDSEIYLFKVLENSRKKSTMKYAKQAKTPLLDQRLTKLNFGSLSHDLDKRYAEIVSSTARESEFRNMPVAEKISKIRTVTSKIDVGTQQEFGSIYAQETENKALDLTTTSTTIYSKLFAIGPKLSTKSITVSPATVQPVTPAQA